MRPRIAVTGPTHGGGPAYFFTNLQVRLSGGLPTRVHPAMNWEDVEFDGLILGGGADISPEHYSDPLHSGEPTNEIKKKFWMRYIYALFLLLIRELFSYKSSRGKTDPERDVVELALLQRALTEKKPVLGICRGMQIINVYLGGSLHRSLKEFYVEEPQMRTVFPQKKIRIEESSGLSKIFHRRFVEVNALHDQAVNQLGEGVIATAREDSGIIQAIEVESDVTSIIGVQWHPEFLVYNSIHRALFNWMVDLSGSHLVMTMNREAHEH